MLCFACTTDTFRSASKAMAKAAAAKLRQAGVLSTSVNWTARASVCERCPMRVVHRGESFCGKPFLQQIDRDPIIDGCGCPTREKAKSPEEHCPVNRQFQAAHTAVGHCDCKWCAAS